MTTNHDSLVLELHNEIEKREKEIKKNQDFIPATNCSMKLFGETYNFHVLSVAELYVLHSLLNGIEEDARNKVKIGQFTMTQYMKDIRQFIIKKETVALAEELKQKKQRLENLLSADAKKRAELEEIQKSLGL